MNQVSYDSQEQDKFIFIMLLIQAPVILLSGLIGESLFTFSFVASALLVSASLGSYFLLKNTPAFSIAAAVIMMLYSSTLIQSQLGMIEMHFHIFATMPLFLIYQKPQPIIAALLTTAGYHIGFMYVQMAGVHIGDMPIMVFAGHHRMDVMIIHCVFAACEAAILIYMAFIMRKSSAANEKIASAIEYVSNNNDLSIRIDNASTSAETSLNNLLTHLSELFSDYQAIANTMNTTCANIIDSTSEAFSTVETNKLNSEQTAAASEEVSLGMKEISHTIAQSAEIVSELEKDTINDREKAQQITLDMNVLSDDIGQVSDALQALTKDVDAITQLLQSIRSISEQTNLLALNAAIEAARAGESGRGFAVVADEVRTLAQRSSESTNEIEKVLSNLNVSVSTTVKSMASGREQTEINVKHSATIADSLLSRSAEVSNIADSSREIAENTLAQESTINEINNKVNENAMSIQHLAELVQTLVECSNSISEVTKEYDEKARIFKI